MGAFALATVVTVHFPFSDLSNSKLRPAVLLATVGRGDMILLQVTSKSYADPLAVRLDATDFVTGGLERESFVRPTKIFTANASIIHRSIGTLTETSYQRVRAAVIDMLADATYSAP